MPACFEALIGARIRLLRVGLNLTPEQLGARVGVRGTMVRSWEVGDRAPSLRTAVPLAAALGVTLDELVDFKSAHEPINADNPAPLNGYRIGSGLRS